LEIQQKNRETDPKYPLYATNQEELELAQDLICKCIILMKVLNEFDLTQETKASDILSNDKWAEFSEKNVGSIEILNAKEELERVFFQIPDMCHNLSDETKDKLIRGVNRESPVDKVEDFVVKSGLLKFEIRHQTRIANSKIGFLARQMNYLRNLLLIIVLVINILLLVYLVETPTSETPVIAGLSGYPTTSIVQTVLFILAIIATAFSAVWLGIYLWNWAPVIIEKGRQERQNDLKQINLVRKKEGKEPLKLKFDFLKQIWDLLSDGAFLYRIVYFVLAAAGIAQQETFCFHLLDISAQSPQTLSVLAAVTTNGSSILLTALLGIILVYNFTMISFWYFSIYYTGDGLACTSLWTCFVTTLSYGIRSGGGIADVLDPADYFDGGIYWARYVFDIAFWIVIIIIILNVVFGIILDTFGALRDEKAEIEEEIKTKCFICGISANTFQQKALGFRHHIKKKDHNLWNYLYFFVYLDLKNKDEFTAAETYVYEKNQALEIAYFPLDKAICLMKSSKKKKKKN